MGFYFFPTSAGPTIPEIMENPGKYFTSDTSQSRKPRQKKNGAWKTQSEIIENEKLWWPLDIAKTIRNKAFSAKRANMDRSQNDKMNEKHCGFCIVCPRGSYVAVEILAKSCRKTAFQARRRHAKSCKIKKRA